MQVPSIKDRTLDQAVVAINKKFDAAHRFGRQCDNARISAGLMLLELKARIEAGEAGNNISWREWYQASGFIRSYRDANKIIQLAKSENPEAAIEEEREETRERMTQHRELGRTVRPKDEDEQETPDEGLVDREFRRAVKVMTAEQLQQFAAKLKDYLKWSS